MVSSEADKVADEIIAALGDGPSKGCSDCPCLGGMGRLRGATQTHPVSDAAKDAS